MFGPETGSLVIYTDTKANPMRKVNEIIGEQGNQWIQLNTDIAVTLQNKEYLRIVIEAVVGNGSLSRTKHSSCFSTNFLAIFI